MIKVTWIEFGEKMGFRGKSFDRGGGWRGMRKGRGAQTRISLEDRRTLYTLYDSFPRLPSLRRDRSNATNRICPAGESLRGAREGRPVGNVMGLRCSKGNVNYATLFFFYFAFRLPILCVCVCVCVCVLCTVLARRPAIKKNLNA